MFPLETEALQAYLPHRPPMIWIDRVLASTPSGGTCEVVLRKDALYFQKGRLIHTASIEWIESPVRIRSRSVPMTGSAAPTLVS